MDGWMDGWMERQTDRQTDREREAHLTLREKISALPPVREKLQPTKETLAALVTSTVPPR